MTKKRKSKRGRNGSGSLPVAWAQSVADKVGAGGVRANAIAAGKMSDVVSDYASPLLDEFGECEEDVVTVLELACIFWNLSLMHSLNSETYKDTEPDLMRLLYDEPYFLTPAGALNLIGYMMRRWDEDYSWYQRIIVDKKIEIRKHGPYMSIVSAPVAEGNAPRESE